MLRLSGVGGVNYRCWCVVHQRAEGTILLPLSGVGEGRSSSSKDAVVGSGAFPGEEPRLLVV